MPWTPESTSSLSEDMDAMSVEESSMKLWAEFLAGYFDGASHFGLPYPKASILYQQAKPGKLLDTNADGTLGDGVNIHLVTNLDGDTVTRWDQGLATKQAFVKAVWTFQVRASVKRARTDGATSQSLCRSVSDALFCLLLNHAALLPLSRAGMLQVRAKPSRIVNNPDFAMRAFIVKARLIFPAATQTVIVVNGGILAVN